MPRNRFDPVPGRATMKAVVTTGNGGYDKLVYRDVPIPVPDPGEVLLQVLAAGVNNTEINTRLGWYSQSVTTDTSATARAAETQAPTRRRTAAGVRRRRFRSSRAPIAAAAWLTSRVGLTTPGRPARAGTTLHAHPRVRRHGHGLDGLGFRRRVCAVRQGTGVRGVCGGLRLERRGTGLDTLRLRHGGKHAAPCPAGGR